MDFRTFTHRDIIPFMAAPNRSCLTDSTFFIHPPVWEFMNGSRETINSLQDKIRELTSYRERYAQILDNSTSDIGGHKLSEYLSGESIRLSSSLAEQDGICNSAT